ncbi:MAG: HAMP domain-containing sensor histidine kinase, partial [Bdellovibrionia bacterium]
MKNTVRKLLFSFENFVLVVFSVLLVLLVAGSLASVATLHNTIASKGEDVDAKVSALIEIEKLRNLIEVKTADARGYFLIGSKALFDEQAELKKEFEIGLANFEKQHPLPKIPELVKRLTELEAQHQDAFDQGLKFREKKTESKIVGQFFQSKTSPLRKDSNAALDEMAKIVNDDLARVKGESLQIAARVESQVTRDMKWLVGTAVFLVLGLMLVILRLTIQRSRHQAERDRLFENAKKAHQTRDEVTAAISRDLKNPLGEITQCIDSIATTGDVNSISDTISTIKSSVNETESLIKDILDQAKADEGRLTLRLDQLEINEMLGEARLMLEPMAKKRDVRLQIDSANPPILAFFDRERVLRVLSNLVGNAVKFSPKHGKVAIRVRGDQQFAYISVTDSGPGIPEKNRARMF